MRSKATCALCLRDLGASSGGRSRRPDRVLTAFGCEQSFAQAAGSVLEHYGFEISASAVRIATLKHAHRAQQQLETEYVKTFRALPAIGSEQVIAQADGTMICTVEPGKRQGRRPRQWKEMRLMAAQAKGSVTTVYDETFGSVRETGAIARARRAGVKTAASTPWEMEPIGCDCKAGRYSATKATSCATTFTSVNTWEMPPRVAAPPNPIPGDAPNKSDSKPEQWPR